MQQDSTSAVPGDSVHVAWSNAPVVALGHSYALLGNVST